MSVFRILKLKNRGPKNKFRAKAFYDEIYCHPEEVSRSFINLKGTLSVEKQSSISDNLCYQLNRKLSLSIEKNVSSNTSMRRSKSDCNVQSNKNPFFQNVVIMRQERKKPKKEKIHHCTCPMATNAHRSKGGFLKKSDLEKNTTRRIPCNCNHCIQARKKQGNLCSCSPQAVALASVKNKKKGKKSACSCRPLHFKEPENDNFFKTIVSSFLLSTRAYQKQFMESMGFNKDKIRCTCPSCSKYARMAAVYAFQTQNNTFDPENFNAPPKGTPGSRFLPHNETLTLCSDDCPDLKKQYAKIKRQQILKEKQEIFKLKMKKKQEEMTQKIKERIDPKVKSNLKTGFFKKRKNIDEVRSAAIEEPDITTDSSSSSSDVEIRSASEVTSSNISLEEIQCLKEKKPCPCRGEDKEEAELRRICAEQQRIRQDLRPCEVCPLRDSIKRNFFKRKRKPLPPLPPLDPRCEELSKQTFGINEKCQCLNPDMVPTPYGRSRLVKCHCAKCRKKRKDAAKKKRTKEMAKQAKKHNPYSLKPLQTGRNPICGCFPKAEEIFIHMPQHGRVSHTFIRCKCPDNKIKLNVGRRQEAFVKCVCKSQSTKCGVCKPKLKISKHIQSRISANHVRKTGFSREVLQRVSYCQIKHDNLCKTIEGKDEFKPESNTSSIYIELVSSNEQCQESHSKV